MGITHVIRGSEYLSSTPKYNLLYKDFGWDIPTYIHCPPVMKDAQNKLSKRNGDASYQDLRRQRLPERSRAQLHSAAGLESQGRARDFHAARDDRGVRRERHRQGSRHFRPREAALYQCRIHPRHERGGDFSKKPSRISTVSSRRPATRPCWPRCCTRGAS